MSLIAIRNGDCIFSTTCPVHCDYMTCCPGFWDFGNANIIGGFIENSDGKRLSGPLDIGAGAIVETLCGDALEGSYVVDSDEVIIDYQKPWCVTICGLVQDSIGFETRVGNNTVGIPNPGGSPILPGTCYGASTIRLSFLDNVLAPGGIVAPFNFVTSLFCSPIARSVCLDSRGDIRTVPVWAVDSDPDNNGEFCCICASMSVDPCDTKFCCRMWIDGDYSIADADRDIIQSATIGDPLPTDFPAAAPDGCYIIWEDIWGDPGEQRYYIGGGMTQELDGSTLTIQDNLNTPQIHTFNSDPSFTEPTFPGFIQGWHRDQTIRVFSTSFSDTVKSFEYKKEYCCDLEFAEPGPGESQCEPCLLDDEDTTPQVVRMIVSGVQEPGCEVDSTLMPGCTENICDDPCTQHMVEIFSQIGLIGGIELTGDGCDWQGIFTANDFNNTLSSECGIEINFSIAPTQFLVDLRFFSDTPGSSDCFMSWEAERFDGDPCFINQGDGLPIGTNFQPVGSPSGCCWLDLSGVGFTLTLA